MGVIRQDSGKIMTTRGYKNRDYRQCGNCGQDKPDLLFTMDPNGKFVCSDCAGAKHVDVLKQEEVAEGDAE